MANLWPEKERDREEKESWETKTNVYYFKFRVDQFYCATNWAKECSYGRGRSIHQFLWRPSECRRRGKNIKPYAMHATCTWRISDAVPPPPSDHAATQIAICSGNKQNSLCWSWPRGESNWARLRHPVSTNLMAFALLLLLQLICIAVVVLAVVAVVAWLDDCRFRLSH